MLRLLAGLAVLSLSLVCQGAPLSRWSSTSLEGAQAMQTAGRDATTLFVLRAGLDPVRSLDGGATWTGFTVSGQRPVAFRGAPTDARAWYAEVSGAGVYRSRDGGDSWTRLESVTSLAFEIGSDPNLLYAVRTAGASAVGLRVSTDGGDTWQDRDFPSAFTGANVVPSPADPDLVFVATNGGLMRSRDRGATWTSVRPAGSALAGYVVTADRRDGSIAYAAQAPIEAALWVTRDYGATWTRALTGVASAVADPLTAGRAYAAIAGTLFETRDAGRTWVKVDEGGRAARDVAVAGGRRIAVAVAESRAYRLDVQDGALALGADLWWNPSESGAGWTITQHASNRPFIVWYTYDATGAQVWRVIPGGSWQDRTFSGEMFETTGPAYFTGAFDPSRVTVRSVGQASLRFDGENDATFSWTLAGVTREKRITRQLFAAPTAGPGESFGDLWWNAAESGWGITINQQHNRVFAAWYVYGEDGRPLWVVMPDSVLRAEVVGGALRTVARGDIYTTRGPAEGAPFDPAQVVVTRVGTATVRFQGTQSAELEYTAFGRTATRAITRQPF